MPISPAAKRRLDMALPASKVVLFVALLAPLASWVWHAMKSRLGADPIAYLTHASGEWALYCLLASLAMTPLRRLMGWSGPIRYRRMLGLYAFFYASIHLAVYLILDLDFALAHLWQDIVKRPYVTVGFGAWLLMLPLALTSSQRMMKRLGRRWQVLHRTVYIVGGLACLHYWWLVKADWRWPAFFAAIYLALMLARLARVALLTKTVPSRPLG